MAFHHWPVWTVFVVGMELVSIVILKFSQGRQRMLLLRRFGNRPYESLNKTERGELEFEIREKFDRTWQRKLELGVIAYHLPALSSWVSITGRNVTPPWYYWLVTMIFWFAVLSWVLPHLGVLLVIPIFR